MGCVGSKYRHDTEPLIVSASKVDALSDDILGRIECSIPNAYGKVHVNWCDNEGHACALHLSDDNLIANDVPPGDYTICAIDDIGESVHNVMYLSQL